MAVCVTIGRMVVGLRVALGDAERRHAMCLKM
jgi:hypothetical protein